MPFYNPNPSRHGHRILAANFPCDASDTPRAHDFGNDSRTLIVPLEVFGQSSRPNEGLIRNGVTMGQPNKAMSWIGSGNFHEVPSLEDAEIDVDAMLSAFSLQSIQRYFGQAHWYEESAAAARANEIELGLKLENVAAHSWHVADASFLLSGHFKYLDRSKVTLLAMLHDKLEMFTGDFDPVGSDGKGTFSHAFCDDRKNEKLGLERLALNEYVASLRPAAQQEQTLLFDEILAGTSPEARFVKAVDKLQALAYVLLKKDGALTNEHLEFTVQYSRKSIEYFPDLCTHYRVLIERVLNTVAKHRKINCDELSIELKPLLSISRFS